MRRQFRRGPRDRAGPGPGAFARLFEWWGEMRSEEYARNFAYWVAIKLARSHLRKVLRVMPFGLRRSDEPQPGRLDRTRRLAANGRPCSSADTRTQRAGHSAGLPRADR